MIRVRKYDGKESVIYSAAAKTGVTMHKGARAHRVTKAQDRHTTTNHQQLYVQHRSHQASPPLCLATPVPVVSGDGRRSTGVDHRETCCQTQPSQHPVQSFLNWHPKLQPTSIKKNKLKTKKNVHTRIELVTFRWHLHCVHLSESDVVTTQLMDVFCCRIGWRRRISRHRLRQTAFLLEKTG